MGRVFDKGNSKQHNQEHRKLTNRESTTYKVLGVRQVTRAFLNVFFFSNHTFLTQASFNFIDFERNIFRFF